MAESHCLTRKTMRFSEVEYLPEKNPIPDSTVCKAVFDSGDDFQVDFECLKQHDALH